MWEAAIRNTITGALVDLIDIESPSWMRLLSAPGRGSLRFPVDGQYSRAQLVNLFSEWERTFELSYDGVTQFAGISEGVTYDAGRRAWAVNGLDLWAIWEAREAVDRTHPNSMKWSTTVTGASRSLLAKRAVQRGTTDPADGGVALPLILEADQPGALARTYYGYHRAKVGDVLEDLIDEGLDVDFEPTRVGGLFRWRMRTGEPLAGVTHELYLSAPEENVAAFVERRDGSKMLTNSIQIGEGSEQDTLARSMRVIGSGLPTLDRTTSRKDVTDQLQLQAFASTAIAEHATPTIQWDVEVPIVEAKDYRLGDTLRLHFDGEPAMNDGYAPRRIVKKVGNGDTVTVSLQPSGGGS